MTITSDSLSSSEVARQKKNARQREYGKRTNYAANTAYLKKNARSISIRLFKNTDAEVLEKLDSVENKTDYIRQLILADIKKDG